MLEPLDDLGRLWDVVDEDAEPGYYAATLDSGIRGGDDRRAQERRAPVHVPRAPRRAARHRLLAGRPGDPARPDRAAAGAPALARARASRRARSSSRALRWRSTSSATTRAGGRCSGTTGGSCRAARGSTSTASAPPRCGRSGSCGRGRRSRGRRSSCGSGSRCAASSRPARTSSATAAPEPSSFDDAARGDRAGRGSEALGQDPRRDTPSTDKQTVFSTALYHSLIKPCLAPDESPFWPADGPFVFDIATMWDIYRTQLPLLTALAARHGPSSWPTRCCTICEEEGNLPDRLPDGPRCRPVLAARAARSRTRSSPTCASSACPASTGTGRSCTCTTTCAGPTARSSCSAAWRTRSATRSTSRSGTGARPRSPRTSATTALAEQFDALAARWVNAFDPDTGLLLDSTFYEGGRWNYSFRLLHDMAARIELAGGDDAFVALLDEFFGFGAPPVDAAGAPARPSTRWPPATRSTASRASTTSPTWRRPGRTTTPAGPTAPPRSSTPSCNNQFGTGRGGLPGNDDSGGLSSWYVWASLGLFPVAGQNLFLSTRPRSPGVDIDVGDATFMIETAGFVEPEPDGPRSTSSRSTLDGEPLDRTLAHAAPSSTAAAACTSTSAPSPQRLGHAPSDPRPVQHHPTDHRAAALSHEPT